MWHRVETTTSLTLDTVMTSQVDPTLIENQPTLAALQCPPGRCLDVPMTTMTSSPVQETNTTWLDCQYQVDKRLVAPIVMAMFGVLGNVLALVVLYNTKIERRRSAFYSLVAGLALTDLLGQVLTSPLPIAAYGKGLNFSTDQNLCMFHGFLMVSFGLVTPLIVCLMALERIGALCCTYFCSRFLSKSRVRTALVCTWTFAMLFAALPLIGFGRYEPQFPCSWCFLKFHFHSMEDLGISERSTESSPSTITRGILYRSYAYACLYAFINLIVIIITVISNIVVIIVLLKARKRRRLLARRPGTYPTLQNYPHQPSPETVVKRGGGSPGKAVVVPPGGRRDSQRVAQDLELQMVWLLCGMTLVFTCCWTPFIYQIIANVTSGVDTKPSRADVFLVRAAAMNQILDPWVYILLRRSLFRKIKSGITRAFKCRDSVGCGGKSTTTGRGRVSFGLQRRKEVEEEKGEVKNELLGAHQTEGRSPGIVLSVVQSPLITQQQQQQQQEQHPSCLRSISGGSFNMLPLSSTSPLPVESTSSHTRHCNCYTNCQNCGNHSARNKNRHGETYTHNHGDGNERQLLVTANQEAELNTATSQESAPIATNQDEATLLATEHAVKGLEADQCHCVGEQTECSHVGEDENIGSISGPETWMSQTSTYITAESCIINVLSKEPSLSNKR